jgi:hypothetical protein
MRGDIPAPSIRLQGVVLNLSAGTTLTSPFNWSPGRLVLPNRCQFSRNQGVFKFVPGLRNGSYINQHMFRVLTIQYLEVAERCLGNITNYSTNSMGQSPWETNIHSVKKFPASYASSLPRSQDPAKFRGPV